MDFADRTVKRGASKLRTSFEHPADIGLGGKMPPFCRDINRITIEYSGKNDRDRVKNAKIPTDILKGCPKTSSFWQPLCFLFFSFKIYEAV